ncbi:hypothetical protein LTR85_003001 [Meristemomyces frigidus]|nr:hypothetical protein LTR85_003001 [Meristemomyces frigidus]
MNASAPAFVPTSPTPATTADKASSAAPHDEETPAAAKDGRHDAGKLDDLIVNIDKRLAGGLHGEFFEEGSKMEGTKRHGQLEMMFGLRKELEVLRKQKEKESRAADAEADSKGRKSGLGNANIVATIKNVVQEQLSQPLRDLEIKNERLEHRSKQAEDLAEKQNNTTTALLTKSKKASESLEKRLKKAEDLVERQSSMITELETNLSAAKQPDGKQDSKIATLEIEVNLAVKLLQALCAQSRQTDSSLKRLRAQVSDLDRDLQSAHQDYDSLRERVDRYRDDSNCDGRYVHRLAQRIEELEERPRRRP